MDRGVLESFAKHCHETAEMNRRIGPIDSPLVWLFGNCLPPNEAKSAIFVVPIARLKADNPGQERMMLHACAIATNSEAYCFISDSWHVAMSAEERKAFKGSVRDHPRAKDAIYTLAEGRDCGDCITFTSVYEIDSDDRGYGFQARPSDGVMFYNRYTAGLLKPAPPHVKHAALQLAPRWFKMLEIKPEPMPDFH